MGEDRGRERPTLAQAARAWHGIGWRSFGGPAGQIAELHRVVVEERRWMSEERFLHALNVCMLLPGPEAQQLATYCGWHLHGLRGGLVSGGLFILPGFAVMLLLSALYASGSGVPLLAALFQGLQAAVVVLVVQALVRIGRRALRRPWTWGVASLSFLACAFTHAPYPLVLLGAALVGVVFSAPARATSAELRSGANAPDGAPARPRTLLVLAAGCALWLAPLALIAGFAPRAGVWVDEAGFFAQTALITFGGAYAVLSHVAARAVHGFGWLSEAQMLAGLSLAETTPGPLILVLEFVGFLAAYQAPGGLAPLLAGTLGALLVSWMTFAPSFLLVFLCAPHVERLRTNRWLAGALAGITPAVAGVIAQLSLWFTLRTLFARVGERSFGVLHVALPEAVSVRWVPVALVVASALALFRLRLGLGWILAGAALAGLAACLLGLSA